METTRLRILDIMQTRQRVSSRELARLTHVTPADIRHHLRGLEAEGRIRKTGETLVVGRGRPLELYTLTHPEGNLAGLAGRLLELAAADEAGLSALATSFAPDGPPEPGRHITSRLVSAMGKLDDLAYRPRWEAHPAGPQVIFENCPYAEIIAEHPALCHMDALLLENLLGQETEQIEQLERNDEGTLQCRFVVGLRTG